MRNNGRAVKLGTLTQSFGPLDNQAEHEKIGHVHFHYRTACKNTRLISCVGDFTGTVREVSHPAHTPHIYRGMPYRVRVGIVGETCENT